MFLGIIILAATGAAIASQLSVKLYIKPSVDMRRRRLTWCYDAVFFVRLLYSTFNNCFLQSLKKILLRLENNKQKQ